MKLKVKHASLVLVQVAVAAALAACGGSNGDAGEAAQESADTADRTAQTEGFHRAGQQEVTLTVTASEGGKVVSTPAGIDCTSASSKGCSATFPKKTHV